VNLYLRGRMAPNVDSAVIDLAGLEVGAALRRAPCKTHPAFQGYMLVVSPQNLIGYEMLAGPG